MAISPKHVVIIGHGLSGCSVAKELVDKCKQRGAPNITITVVDSRDFYETDMLMPYALMKAGNDAYEANACSQSLLKVPGVAAYKKDTVASVSRSTKAGEIEGFTVLTNDGTSMDADAVVCATGFTIPVLKPLTGQAWDARKEQIAELRSALKGAMTVVIAGSGPAGINTAGEVRNNVDIDAGCKIHLICSSDLVLSDEFGDGDRAQLTRKICEAPGMVLHTDRVTGDFRSASLSPKTVELKSGKTIHADVYLPCFAEFVAGRYLSEIDGATLPNGQVAVNPKSLEASAKGLFAIGCSDIVKLEGAIDRILIENQSKTIAANVLHHLGGKGAAVVHGSGHSFAAHALAAHFGFGYYSQIHTEKCGCPGFCLRYCCGFPFPCLFGCWCAGYEEGPCGHTCLRPAGRGLSKMMETTMAKKGATPMLDQARKKQKKQKKQKKGLVSIQPGLAPVQRGPEL